MSERNIRVVITSIIAFASVGILTGCTSDSDAPSGRVTATATAVTPRDYADLAATLTAAVTPGRSIPGSVPAYLPEGVTLTSANGNPQNFTVCVEDENRNIAVRETAVLLSSTSVVHLVALNGDCHPGTMVADVSWKKRVTPNGTEHTTLDSTDEPYSRELLAVLQSQVPAIEKATAR